jgi:hypothetical protein
LLRRRFTPGTIKRPWAQTSGILIGQIAVLHFLSRSRGQIKSAEPDKVEIRQHHGVSLSNVQLATL